MPLTVVAHPYPPLRILHARRRRSIEFSTRVPISLTAQLIILAQIHRGARFRSQTERVIVTYVTVQLKARITP